MAADSTIVIEILTGISLFIYIGLQLQALPDIIRYQELYDLMNNDQYRFQPQTSRSAIFRRYDYSRTTGTNIPVGDHIIFFPDGDIKLNDNLYIWKSTMVGNLIRWYYYRKFIKLKDEKIDLYNWREMRERYSQLRHDAFMQQHQNKSSFKFLRG
jgi:hypothetical protein